MDYISKKLTDYIVKKGVIKEEDYEIYHYGLQSGIEVILCILLSIIIATVLDVFLESCVVALVLFSLRAYICGIHLKRYVSCLVWSTTVLTVGTYLSTFISLSRNVVLAICLLVLPIIHKLSYYTVAYNSQLEEIAFFTKQRKRIIVGILIFLVLLFCFGESQLIEQVFYALLVALGSILVEIIRIKVIKKSK